MSRAEAVIMCYGVTSAGKTYTMQGTDKQPGLVPRALAHIFKVARQIFNKQLCRLGPMRAAAVGVHLQPPEAAQGVPCWCSS